MQQVASRESKRQIVTHWVLGLIIFPILGALNYVTIIVHGWEQVPWWALLLLGIFDLIGALALWNLIQRTLDWMRFGAIPLYIVRPAQAGESFVSRLMLPAALGDAGVLEAEFLCQHKRWQKTNDGESSNQIVTVLHSDKQTIALAAGGQAGAVEIRFPVPILTYPESVSAQNDEEEEDDPARGFSAWELRIVVQAPRGNVSRTYPIAVHRS